MTRVKVITIAALVGSMATAMFAVASSAGAVENPQRAAINWMLKCQGCHRADGNTLAHNAPPLAGSVSRFLQVEGGREYLIRVPGVSTSDLSNQEIAELMNWLLVRFDPQHVPQTFEPYTAEEVGPLRGAPLRTEASAVRSHLVEQMP